MIGAIIGDIVGSRFEFNNHKSKEFEFFTDECKVTDDSIMTLAIAKAIMEARKELNESIRKFNYNLNEYILVESLAIKNMQLFGRNYPNSGYGAMFSQWIYSENPKPYNSFGNGAAMRISPVGYAANNEKEVVELSKAVTCVKHNHEEVIKVADHVAIALYMAKHHNTKTGIRNRIQQHYYNLNFTIDEIRHTYQFNDTRQDTVPQAITAFLESNSFEDAIRNAISLGGDSDTLAAITGSIAEAYWCI